MILKKRIKLIILGIISTGLYSMMLYCLFDQIAVLRAMFYVLLFFIAFHFFYMEIYHFKLRYFLLVVVSLALIMATVWGQQNLQLILSIFLIHTGIIMLGYFLKDELDNKIRFSSLSFFMSGGYIFTVYITLGFGLALMGFYNKFPFTCESLDTASSSVIKTFTAPVQQQVQAFWGAKIKDIPNTGPFTWVSSQVINQVKQENVSVNMGICDYLLGKVNALFNRPEYRISLTLVMFLLLYPFVRIVFWVMSFFAYLFFKIFYLIGIYTAEKTNMEVEKIV